MLLVPRRVWGGIRENVDSTETAAAVVLAAATIAVIAVSLVLGRRERVRVLHSGSGGYEWTSS